MIEKIGGVHSKERYDYKGNTTAEKYANHADLNNNKAVATDKIIDCNKRGKVSDITVSGKLNIKEPSMSE